MSRFLSWDIKISNNLFEIWNRQMWNELLIEDKMVNQSRTIELNPQSTHPSTSVVLINVSEHRIVYVATFLRYLTHPGQSPAWTIANDVTLTGQSYSIASSQQLPNSHFSARSTHSIRAISLGTTGTVWVRLFSATPSCYMFCFDTTSPQRPFQQNLSYRHWSEILFTDKPLFHLDSSDGRQREWKHRN